MITTAFLEEGSYIKDKNDSININNLLQKKDLIQFPGFETVLF